MVRVCEPEFQNLPRSYTWPLEKWTHSCTRSSKMLTYSYTALLIFYSHLLLVIDKYRSQFIEYQQNKRRRKVSGRKKYMYIPGCQKSGAFHIRIKKVIYFLLKKGG